MPLPYWLRTLIQSNLPILQYWPICRTPFEFVQTVVGDRPLVALDIGARGDIPPPWLALDGVAEVVAVEPDADACDRLRAVYDRRGNGNRYKIICRALSDTGGPRTLYSYASASGSSILPMTGAAFQKYCENLNDMKTIPIETARIEDLLDEAGVGDVHLIKLDIQGVELDVLKSLTAERLSHLMCVEAEVFLQRDDYRPGFQAFDNFLTSHRFELFDVRTHRTYMVREGKVSLYNGKIFGVHNRSPTIAARLWEFDVIYFLRADEVVKSRSADGVRRLAAAYCTYNYFAEAHSLVEAAEAVGILDEAAGISMRRAIVRWHRKLRWRWLHSVNPLAKAARTAQRWLWLGDQIRWARSLWVGYPSA